MKFGEFVNREISKRLFTAERDPHSDSTCGKESGYPHRSICRNSAEMGTGPPIPEVMQLPELLSPGMRN
jgi:hypothetical protein